MIRRVLLILMFGILSALCPAQEWIHSLDVAKRLAFIQDKMLLVMWEDSTLDEVLVMLEDKNKKLNVRSLFNDREVNSLIWDYFIPVKIKDSKYGELYNEIKDKRNLNYINKFNDDSIKIMDVNGNILNVNYNEYYFDYINLSYIFKNYALKTTYLKQEFENYIDKRTFKTTYDLASKYLDLANYVNEDIKIEIIDLAKIYLDEAIVLLENYNSNNKVALSQKCNLLELKQYLILNKPKRVLRILKKNKKQEITENNQSLYAFLNYTAYKLLKNEDAASNWEAKVSKEDLKKSNFILKINL